ncbi:FkbM family methyltransferase [Candidatus Thiosymbion oneisti]|uniref:FkbM family methyltransferase n=1 Tax=Candidatus Thiosymbion oneisti TaxID=589554 RepID=UPI00105FA2F9|nr:FkbM family methyltransferase [Candidatus Thiosymbion oneisti]
MKQLFENLGLLIPPLRRLYEERDVYVNEVHRLTYQLARHKIENNVFRQELKEKSDSLAEYETENNTLRQELKEKSHSLAEIYSDHIPWELPVQFCASDCIHEGDTVLDVGGNVGGVAIAFSRMVGRGGVVYTFEPNMEIWPHLLENLMINDAGNVSHVPLACFSQTGKIMQFYSGPSCYKAESGLMKKIDGAISSDVVTISIDDFCDVNNIRPAFMKIDVEGAEIHVLRSASNYIDDLHFPMILEYQSHSHPDQNDPLVYLEEKGYLFFDVNTYNKETAKSYSLMPEFPLVNVLCVHKDSDLASLYLRMCKTQTYKADLSETDVLTHGDINLEPGRYIVKVDFDCPEDVIASIAVENDSGYLAYYESDTKHLKQHSCSNMVIELGNDESLTVALIKKGDYNASLKSIEISKIELGGNT